MELNANIDSLLEANLIDATHAKRVELLLVQDNGGRVKPLSTLSSEYIRKISRKQELYGQSSTQILIGMMSNPVAWGNISIIKVSNPELKAVLGTQKKRITFIQLFEKDGTYKLNKLVEDAYSKQPKNQDKFDKDVIAVDERVNLCYLIFSGGFLRLFPLANDSNNVWHPYSKNELFSSNDSLFVTNIMSMYFNAIKSAKENKDWTTSTEILDYIQKFQEKYVSPLHTDAESFESTFTQGLLSYDLLQYKRATLPLKPTETCEFIRKINRKHNLIPNDVAILCSDRNILKQINDEFIKIEKSIAMVETTEELNSLKKFSGPETVHEDIKKLKRRKKTYFMQNSGLTKFSTVHSFKGMDSSTVFYILTEADSPELIYTGITRAKTNLIIIDLSNSTYSDYLEKEIGNL